MVNFQYILSKLNHETDAESLASFIHAGRKALFGYCGAILHQKGDFKQKTGLCQTTIEEMPFSCLYVRGSSSSLHVAFNGAKRGDHNYFVNPGVSRWSYFTLYDGCFLGINDPMFYLYPNLKLGWYYGDRDRFFVMDSLKIVDLVIANNGIDRNNVTFCSSSGGGYAALMAALNYPGSLSISLNPQIFIAKWHYAAEFSSITGIDLEAPDHFHRNNPVEMLLESPSKHVILVNAYSESDIKTQLKPMLEALGVKARYGLNQYGNLLLWVYASPGAPGAHTAFETKPIYCAIDYIANKFKNGTEWDLESFQPLAVLLRRCLHKRFNKV